jgi:hypothetical protein
LPGGEKKNFTIDNFYHVLSAEQEKKPGMDNYDDEPGIAEYLKNTFGKEDLN